MVRIRIFHFPCGLRKGEGVKDVFKTFDLSPLTEPY